MVDDLSGFGLSVVQHFVTRAFDSQTSGQVQVFAAPTANGNNNWNFMLWIPVASNDGINFEVGLINLQTEELKARIEITWAPETDAVVALGGGTGFAAGRADIYAEWYEVPDPRVVQFPPLNIVHRLLEDRTTIQATGDVRYPILRQGTIQQLYHVVRINNLRDTPNVVALRMELNRSDRVYRYLLAAQLWHQVMRLGQDLPAGCFAWDLWFSQLDVSQGDGRDMVDTEAIAQVDSIVEIAAGAALGAAGTNNLDTIRRFTQVLIP
jgi:hypothetical protein